MQGEQRVPYKINPRRNTPRHILIKLSKIKHKEKILKAAREKQQVTHKGIPIRLTADLSAETLQARREWQDIFKVMKEKNLQPRLLYQARTEKQAGKGLNQTFNKFNSQRRKDRQWKADEEPEDREREKHEQDSHILGQEENKCRTWAGGSLNAGRDQNRGGNDNLR